MEQPDPVLVATRRALHAVSELVLAGPQYAAAGDIRLRVVDGGFATWVAPEVLVLGAAVTAGGRSQPIDGRTAHDVAAALGLEARSLDDVYQGGPGVGADDVLVADEAAARMLLDALVAGDAALRALAPDAERVLWPEHFDVGITVDEVNYGVSPGDDHIQVPYAYVGPWTVPAADDFWNQPFGAARTMSDLADAGQVREFFEEARGRLPSR